jgi:hypothetical protein
MNRLFIIGNGFDLAHGLPTSYNDFINNFWANLSTTYQNDNVKKLVLVDDMNYGYINYSKNPLDFNEFIQNVKGYATEYGCKFEEKTYTLSKSNSSVKTIFKFQSNFFFLINKSQSIDNWVDIENLYYSELKRIVKSEKLDTRKTVEDCEREKRGKVKELNEEFNQVKTLLINYLKDVVNNYDFTFSGNTEWSGLCNLLKPISRYNNESGLLHEFNDAIDKEMIENIFEEEQKTRNKDYSMSYFLNFNYTPLISEYCKKLGENFKNEQNQIHGNIFEEIIFGFGDESDIDYHLIENINDNEYLNFFKSFEYLENDRYNKFLNFLDLESFQLIIMGHSLGLSDRVLLKTVFEHENCKSIKVYYYSNDNVDNFRDIIQNMSRHFSDKTLMRKKVVNKLLCKPLPQIQIMPRD